MDDLRLASGLFLPILLGLLAHGITMRTSALAVLARPIDGGRTIGGRAIFGANKTYRGIVTVSVGTAVAIAVEIALGWAPIELAAIGVARGALFGAVLGAAAMLSELPNSFVKRRLDIAPGKPPVGWTRPIWWLVDQSDVMLGGWIVASTIVQPTLRRVLISIAMFAVAHQMATWIGYGLKLRKTAR